MRVTKYGLRNASCGMLTGILLVTGCAPSLRKPPGWFLHPQTAYSTAHYLVSIGEGDSRRNAENSAAAGLARIFESNIRATETETETTTETRGSQSTFDQFSELRSDIRIDSEQNLLNIQFGETYIDPDRRVHAVAFIPRAETAEIYRKKIEEHASAIVFLTRLSEIASSPIEKYALQRAAIRKALQNEILLAQLDILDLSARDRTSLDYDPQLLYSQAVAAAQAVTFSVALEGPGGDALRETLTGMGFSESQKAELRFSGNVILEETDLQRGSLVFVRYQLTLNIRTRDGTLVRVLNDSHREGHLSLEEATARIQRSLRAKIHTRIPEELGNFFDQLSSIE